MKLIVFVTCLVTSYLGYSDIRVDPWILKSGLSPIEFVGVHNFHEFVVPKNQESDAVAHFCKKLRGKYQQLGWKDDPCQGVQWRADLKSKDGYPLLHAVFGRGDNVTLFLGGVHPDELTPMHMAFQLGRYLSENPEIVEQEDSRVVIAPLVNPDGFFSETFLRTNGVVDVNRNFLTLDWYERAHKVWLGKKWKKRSRYFPGHFPNTEIETLFQVHLIEDYHPDKLINIHAPLGFLDYDGPGDRRSMRSGERKARELVHVIAQRSRNYRVVDYSIYPGSLGNFAGFERGLPTVTLELESTDPRFSAQYWDKFSPGLMHSVHFPFRSQKKSDRLSNNLETTGSQLRAWMKALDDPKSSHIIQYTEGI